MNSEKNGTNFRKNIRTKFLEKKFWLIKLSIAIALSNVLFFLLFSSEQEAIKHLDEINEGWVEVQLQAILLTPYQMGKKVLLINRNKRKKVSGVLKGITTEIPGTVTVLVEEDSAHELFHHDGWEILPYLRHLTFAEIKRGESYEIHY